MAATDGSLAPKANETLTILDFNANSGQLTYTDENGQQHQYDLSNAGGSGPETITQLALTYNNGSLMITVNGLTDTLLLTGNQVQNTFSNNLLGHLLP